MVFLTASELNSKFHTKGAFYQLGLNGESYKCRGLAKISRSGIESDNADALFVLVNPGSCEPEDKNYVYPSFDQFNRIPLICAKTDPTQYQLMRLMECTGWNMIYIINLSDLCAGNFDDFKAFVNNFKESQNDSHSIFSESRKQDINLLLSENTKIIAGWGSNSFIKNMATHALTELSERDEICGLPYKTKPYYRHPFPMIKYRCVKWLYDMCEVLRERS